MKYLIFDFDGVLGNTENARNEVVSKMENKTIEQTLIDSNAYFSTPTHTRSHDISPEERIENLKWMHQFGWEMLEQDYSFFDDFLTEIKKINDTKLAIVSSGNKVYINQIKKLGLEFTHILDFFDHHSKEEKVEQICKDWNIDVSEAYYFTDTQTDVKELINIMDPAKIIGCAWGYQGYEKLLEVLPASQILKDFSDIHLVLPPSLDDLKEGSSYFNNLEAWSKRDNRDMVIGGFIKNSEGKILVQKRGPNRRLFPNCWDISFGGHVEPDETIYQAMKRELFEETGLKLDQILEIIIIFDWEVEPKSQKAYENPLRREFDFIISVIGDLNNIKIEEDKVSEIRWIGLEDIEILRENRDLDLYVYNLAKKALIQNK
jgi:8-oxo-dGTP pyrophosphatase MutT (NUDIX family)/phosphoglycolate phosphatase-like HAD superfamily hydrolase